MTAAIVTSTGTDDFYLTTQLYEQKQKPSASNLSYPTLKNKQLKYLPGSHSQELCIKIFNLVMFSSMLEVHCSHAFTATPKIMYSYILLVALVH